MKWAIVFATLAVAGITGCQNRQPYYYPPPAYGQATYAQPTYAQPVYSQPAYTGQPCVPPPQCTCP
jgi:predicted small lipoprotein YifL